MDPEVFLLAVRKVPHYMQDRVRDYVSLGVPPGDFLRAVLENDLRMAALRADKDNRAALYEWGCVLDTLPLRIWGSKEKVDRHISICRQACKLNEKDANHG